jgi:Ca2+:H+ antiporter
MVLGLRPREVVITLVVAALTVAAWVLSSSPSFTSFVFATGALAGLAWLVSFSTEQLGERLGPAATGLLQSTLGNLPEFFVVVFALRAGQTVVATTSIIGSIFANALLVLGLTIIVGARRAPDGVMRFSKRLPNDTATLLMLAVFIIVSVGVSTSSNDRASHHVVGISVIGSIALLVVYVFWVWSYVRGGAAQEGDDGDTARLSAWTSSVLLTVAGVGAAFVSDWFVQGLDPAIHALHISKAFAGLVVVAIAGNAIENAAGLALAHKQKSDLAISVVKNSVSQIAVFLFPLLVLTSLLFSHHLTYQMAPIWIAALAMTAVVQWQVTGDGAAPVWEGVALIGFYVILAAVALYE